MGVGGDAQRVASRVDQPHLLRVLVEHQLRIGGDPALSDRLTDQFLGRLGCRVRRVATGRVRERGGRCDGLVEVDHAGIELALPAALWLGHRAPQGPGQPEPRQCEQHERRAPRDDAGHGAADDEPGGRPGDLAAEDVRVHPAAFTRRKVVTGQRRDRGTGGRRDGAERQTGQQQLAIRAGEGAQQRRDAPQDDGDREHRDPPEAVHQRPDRNHEQRPHQQRHGAEQADLGVPDVQRVLELRGDRADRAAVGAVERQHPSEEGDHTGPSRTPDRMHHTTASRAPRGPDGPSRRPARSSRTRAPYRTQKLAELWLKRAIMTSPTLSGSACSRGMRCRDRSPVTTSQILGGGLALVNSLAAHRLGLASRVCSRPARSSWPAAGPHGWARPRRHSSGMARPCCGGSRAWRSQRRRPRCRGARARAGAAGASPVDRGGLDAREALAAAGARGRAGGHGDRAEVAYASSTDVPLLHPRSSVASSRGSPRMSTSSCRGSRLSPAAVGRVSHAPLWRGGGADRRHKLSRRFGSSAARCCASTTRRCCATRLWPRRIPA